MANGDIPRTEPDLLRNFFQDEQPNNSITTERFRDLIASSKYLNGQGWEFDLDGEFTATNKRFCPGGQRTAITIDGGIANFGHPIPPEGQRPFWDVNNNKIIPNGLNNFGIVRISLTANSIGVPANRFDIELDVGGGTFPVIFRQTSVFSKGTGDQTFNYTIPLFSGVDFQANGGTIFTTPLNDANFWQTAITAVAIYIASPAIP